MGEWKPVGLYSSLIRDFNAGKVVDLTPWSGAAFVAALYNRVPYTGICHSQAAETWLWSWIQRAFLALVANKDVAAEETLLAHIQSYLHRAAEAAKSALPPKGSKSAVGDAYTGNNDSGDEDE